MIGGRDVNRHSLARVDQINLTSGQLFNVAPMAYSRNGPSAVASDRCVLVFGGYDEIQNSILATCEAYDPIRDKYVGLLLFIPLRWTSLPDMRNKRYRSGAVHIPKKGDLVIGGSDQLGNTAPNLRSAELLQAADHNGCRWREIAPMLQARCWPSAAYHNGNVYVTGMNERSVEVLTLTPDKAEQWTLVNDCIEVEPLVYSMCAYSGRLFVSSEFRPVSIVKYRSSLDITFSYFSR